MNQKTIKFVLVNWTNLNSFLTTVEGGDADKVKKLLDYEKSHKARKTFLARLHAKYSRLKTNSERSILIGDN